ncbi:hypothetical protein [Candidatus Absconditicoccus praedator]|uniref:hypothetical protein n=1 Tax=Candidatus Absconditicoccus praedator TaxID=2735562 RepID=UPI001E33A53F|nr:hypothetical protein [Candidatus Absconditicoccus praedator]UFX82605.1 hypothetical protein HLG78_00430 [Candidatus Absconditicoccus praedator]
MDIDKKSHITEIVDIISSKVGLRKQYKIIIMKSGIKIKKSEKNFNKNIYSFII